MFISTRPKEGVQDMWKVVRMVELNRIERNSSPLLLRTNTYLVRYVLSYYRCLYDLCLMSGNALSNTLYLHQNKTIPNSTYTVYDSSSLLLPVYKFWQWNENGDLFVEEVVFTQRDILVLLRIVSPDEPERRWKNSQQVNYNL